MACPVLSGSVAILTFRKSPHLIPTWLGKFFQVAESESSSGTFSWNTANHADGMYQIEALAYVTKVDLYLDGKLAGTSAMPTPAFSIDTKKLARGWHTLQVYAWDEAGNVSARSP